MAFRWRADDGRTLNAGLVALCFFRGSEPVLQIQIVCPNWFCKHLAGEERAGCFTLIVCFQLLLCFVCVLIVSFPRDAMGLSVICFRCEPWPISPFHSYTFIYTNARIQKVLSEGAQLL